MLLVKESVGSWMFFCKKLQIRKLENDFENILNDGNIRGNDKI